MKHGANDLTVCPTFSGECTWLNWGKVSAYVDGDPPIRRVRGYGVYPARLEISHAEPEENKAVPGRASDRNAGNAAKLNDFRASL